MKVRILRVLKWVSILLALIVVGLALWVGPMTYRALYPSSHHDTEAPQVPASFGGPAVLVFSKTNGFRHDDAIAAANAMFDSFSEERGWSIYKTENGAVHSAEILSRFEVVIWSNATGNVLSDEQRAALRGYIEQGGTFIAIHGAGDSSHEQWPWYQDELIGAKFIGHTMFPHTPEGELTIEATDHPVMAGLPVSLHRAEEWYSFDRSVRSKGFRVLASVDEGTYELAEELQMGSDHPVIWSHCPGNGRVLYSALGHTGEAFAEPFIRNLTANAIEWAIAGEPCNKSKGA